MKIVGLDGGRLTVFLDVLELGPDRGVHLPELVGAIQERYGFTLVDDAKSNSAERTIVRFENGRLPAPEPGYVTLFEIHAHGLVIQAVNTEVCDRFFRDVIDMGVDELDLIRPSSLAKLIYLSSLVVEFDLDLSGLLSKWASLSQILNSEIKTLYGIDSGVDVSRIAFKPDPNLVPSRLNGVLSDFMLERRVFAPYKSQRFYSVAPLPTGKHIEYLKNIERLL